MRYIIGTIMIAVGVVLILKTEWFVQNFGASAWAEEKLGSSGGTRLLYKLIGIAFIFFGALAVTNLLNNFLLGTVGKVFIR